jgi:hypothetical protein
MKQRKTLVASNIVAKQRARRHDKNSPSNWPLNKLKSKANNLYSSLKTGNLSDKTVSELNAVEVELNRRGYKFREYLSIVKR